MRTKRQLSSSQTKIKRAPRRNRRKAKRSPNKMNTNRESLKRLQHSAPTSKLLDQKNNIQKLRNYVRHLDRQVVQRKSRRINNIQPDFEDELFEYSSLRMSSSSATSTPNTSAGPSTSSSLPKIVMPPPPPIINLDDDSEIEDGEIVERDVDLIQESFAALSRSRKVTDLTPTKNALFYEDRNMDDGSTSSIPIYHVIGSPSPTKPIEITESDEVVCLESTQSIDDSVIFVSEERGAPQPLQKPTALSSPAINQLMKLSHTDTPGNEKKVKPLTPSRQRKLERTKKYRQKKQQERKSLEEGPKKRLILIDGSNVAVSHAKALQGKKFDFDNKNAFSVEGLQNAVNYFENLGFEVRAIIPEYRLRTDRSSNKQLLQTMQENGSLICTASKAYDDRILLESATRLNAAIVSNDFFRDFKSNLKDCSSFDEVINRRQIRYNWVFSEFILTEDPYGKFGPKLQDILYFNN